MTRLIVVLVAACGGGGGGGSTAPKPATCDDVASAMVAQMIEGKEPPPKAAIDSFKSIVVTRCDADHWSAEAVRCLAAAKSAEAFDHCGTLLTQPQQAALVHDQEAALGPKPAKPPGPGE